MARPAWKRPGSPIGKKGPRRTNPKYKRRSRQPWSDKEVKQLRSLAKANTPTGVISLKMERPLASIASKAQREGHFTKASQSLALQSSQASKEGAALIPGWRPRFKTTCVRFLEAVSIRN
jgi:hypothetical protein